MTTEEPEAPGWDAIDQALAPIYGTQKPLHWGPVLHASIGGSDPLDGISVYRVEDPAHWHFVTYGMSELYQPEGEAQEASGWGFEFTLRLARKGEGQPPGWAIAFLNNLARYVCQTGNRFDVGHHMDLNGPIALAVDTAIRAIAFTTDPQLGRIATPNGTVTFLQVVGLTLDELHAAEAWNSEKFLGLFASRDPLLLTDLERRSRLEDESFAREAQAGALRDGSSQPVSFVTKVEWELGLTARVVIGATAARQLFRLLPKRLPFGRSFALSGRSQVVRFEPSDTWLWRPDGDTLVIGLPGELDACSRLCGGMKAERGSYSWEMLPGLELVVVPSEIKDHDGRVVEVVG